MNAVLGLAVVLGGIFGKKKLDTVTTKYSVMKKGVNEFIATSKVGGDTLYGVIGDARRAKGIT